MIRYEYIDLEARTDNNSDLQQNTIAISFATNIHFRYSFIRASNNSKDDFISVKLPYLEFFYGRLTDVYLLPSSSDAEAWKSRTKKIIAKFSQIDPAYIQVKALIAKANREISGLKSSSRINPHLSRRQRRKIIY